MWALGHLGDDAVVPKLRTIAATDDDEDVREIAEKTANFLT
ncbi:HEAT repeat domain-containing protein [Halocatena marina]|uniref:HEAT repeat domain-containing protein n=1 Tax=Halocatena marina TaxID=2934937 RepID=A0ABD5YIX8_9EURY